jgi:hypothetical protein
MIRSRRDGRGARTASQLLSLSGKQQRFLCSSAEVSTLQLGGRVSYDLKGGFFYWLYKLW